MYEFLLEKQTVTFGVSSASPRVCMYTARKLSFVLLGYQVRGSIELIGRHRNTNQSEQET